MKHPRLTAFLVAAVLAASGGFSAWRNHTIRSSILLTAALALTLAAACSERFAVAFHHSWFKLARALGALNTMVLLTLIYGTGFVFYRAWGRMAGRDPLGRRTPPSNSYWVKRASTRQTPEQFEKLY